MSSEGSWTKNFCEMERWFALQTEDESMPQIVETGRVKEVKTACNARLKFPVATNWPSCKGCDVSH